jgi:hypothetical protein
MDMIIAMDIMAFVDSTYTGADYFRAKQIIEAFLMEASYVNMCNQSAVS